MWYRTGTINLTNGSKNVTGTGTLFVSNVKSGFALLGPDFSVYEVDNISSDTALTLKDNYRGTTVTNGVYAIFQTQGIIKDLTDEVTALINTFGAFRDAYNNGDLVGQGLNLKGILNSPSELPSSPAQGDTYLIGTYLYVYTGPTNGWKNSSIAGVTPRGTWNASTAYVLNDLVYYQGSTYRRIVAGTTSTAPSTDTTNWTLFVQKGDKGDTGETGVTPRGMWDSSLAYAVNDLVLSGGSTYRRIVAGTTNTPPASDTTNWQVFAQAGTGQVNTVNGIAPVSNDVTLTTDNISEGSTNQWFTQGRVRSTTLTGLSTTNSSAVSSTDSILVAIGKLVAQQNKKCLIVDQKSSGTPGGAGVAGGTGTRTLNTTIFDDIGITLSSNVFTLPAGTYDIEADIPGYWCGLHKAFLALSTSTATPVLLGSSEYSAAASGYAQTTSKIAGRLVLSSSTSYVIRHFTSSSGDSNCYGVPSGMGGSFNEIYTRLRITKVA